MSHACQSPVGGHDMTRSRDLPYPGGARWRWASEVGACMAKGTTRIKRLGEAIDHMSWPERIAWIFAACTGPSVMVFGGYEVTVSLQAKLLFAALFLLILTTAAYLRLKYFTLSSDTPKATEEQTSPQ